MQFLKAVKQNAPEVLGELRKAPLQQVYAAKLHESHWPAFNCRLSNPR
jgi:methyl coenzyme M reductase subunit C-like uncharacterized protein (methanogenesis marker protein 7)